MFVIIVNQILKMLLLLLLGCLCFRMRLIDENGSKVLANLLLMVVNPMLAIVSLQTEYSAHLAQGLLVAYLLAFLTHLVAAVLSTVLIRTTGNPDCGIDRFASMYSNCGFIGIPLVQSILGNEGVLYLTAYMTVFNFFSWTHGIMIMTGTFSLKELKKGLLSPMIFASILGVVFFFGRIHIPYLLLDSMNYVAGMNTPLAMLIAGISVAQTDLLSMLRNRKLYLISASKLLLMPALLLVVLVLILAVWNRVPDFKTAYWQAYLFLLVMNWFDGIILDRLWVAHGKLWRIEGMEGVPYIKPWKTVLLKRGLATVLYLLIAPIIAGPAVLLSQWLG